MFESIHFTTFSDLSHSKRVPARNAVQNLGTTMEDPSDASVEIVVHGHTSILFPPLSSDFSSEYAITPQGFFLCDHREGYYTRRENYPSYMLCYTVSGEGVLEYGENTHLLKAQDVFWIDCRKHQHYYTKGSSWCHIDVHFWGPAAHVLYREFSTGGGHVCSCGQDSSMLRKLEELARTWDTPQPYSALHISNRISDVLTYLLTLSKSGQFTEVQLDTFAQITKYIEGHFQEDISLEQLAKEASMSKFHFSRLFKLHTGLSPVQYVIRLRISRAKSMLETSAMTVRQIAFHTGFNDVNNFVNHFKKLQGMTPSDYRRQFLSSRH